ncbi:myeloid differentiation primary response protein MyD88 [Amyelois transitella]|uniref:myeloid differentiation primary response protein MyD88 n=1 Tax=Amyelois transitella TaxID=680683 RepID=UPI00067B7D04|nr:myeloid differentiation primary response protein MyD88 [Amyelois transitella]
MASDLQLNNIPLSSLGFECWTILSCLDSKKILSSDGPDRLPRDWRGLTSLLNISVEIVGTICEYPDKTRKVLDIWLQRNDGTATLGKLLEYLERLDRFDVYDDLLDLVKKKNFSVSNANQVALISNKHSVETPNELITYEDIEAGYPQFYNAYVLYVAEDLPFVNELLNRMTAKGFKLCTINNVVPGHQTLYGPVAQLIKTRCHRIILVVSPEFLESPDIKFFSDYAQAVGIESQTCKIIPIIYRDCKLPYNLSYYHKLKYQPQETWYDFWDKLSRSLEVPRTIRSSQSAVNITELITDGAPINNGYLMNSSHNHLTVSSVSRSTISDITADKVSIADSRSLDNISQSGRLKSKRSGSVSKLLRFFKGGKQKAKEKCSVDA